MADKTYMINADGDSEGWGGKKPPPPIYNQAAILYSAAALPKAAAAAARAGAAKSKTEGSRKPVPVGSGVLYVQVSSKGNGNVDSAKIIFRRLPKEEAKKMARELQDAAAKFLDPANQAIANTLDDKEGISLDVKAALTKAKKSR